MPVQEMVSVMSLSAQRRTQCDQARPGFDSKLYNADSDVQRYHDQLVQFEAEKLLGVEGVLNKDQLQKLKKDRSRGQSSSS